MNDAEFDALVRRLEPEAAAAPRLYNARVALFALLGYAYIGGVLLVLLAATVLSGVIVANARGGGAAVVKLVIALLVLVGTIVRAMWVRVSPPEGRRLTRAEAPVLFAEAEEIRRAVQAPRADVVLLTDDYNASVSQVPRLGVFGWPRNYLVVGLTLLEALPREHVRAVLAHEFAHLSRAHGRFGVWIYRVRMTWMQLMARFDASKGAASLIFRRFFDWYVPKFTAYAFVLMRRHEFEADRLAAGVVGAGEMQQTLLDLEVRSNYLGQRFWPGVWREVESREEAPADVFVRLAGAVREPVPGGDAEQWMTGALKRRTDTNDTHPALRDRLAALAGERDGDALLASGRFALRPSAAFAAPAADHYLGTSHAALASELATAWKASASEAWTRSREETRVAREGRAALAARIAAGEALSVDERWQHANWTEELDGADEAYPLYEALRAEAPEIASVNFAVGRLMLRRGDESGIALLERAMEQDGDAVLPACNVAYAFYAGEGRLADADRWRARAVERHRLLRSADEERNVINAGDRYTPSELSAETVAALVAQLDGVAGVKCAYVARKQLAHFADEAPLHVLVVLPRPAAWSLNVEKMRQRFNQSLGALDLPPGVNAFALFGDQARRILKPVRKVEGSLIYEAKRRKAERKAKGAARTA